MPTRNLVTIFLSLIVGITCYQTAQRHRYASIIGSAMTLVEERALEPRTRKELFHAAMDGMMRSLDEHSAFIDPDRFTAVTEHLDQEFGGVGFVVEPNPANGELRVLTPIVGSPAQEAGIASGDVILSIDGRTVASLDPSKSPIDLIRGPVGSTVRLELRKQADGAVVTVDLVRRMIPIESVLGDRRAPDGTWDFRLESHPEIAYLRITEFGEKTIDELDRVTASWQTAPPKGVILDLRRNAGGLLESAVEMCDRFLDAGTIVTIKRRGEELDRPPYVASSGTVLPVEVPMAVLVDGGTASAAEIVAACLQDHGRATIVGERSYGKGTVQQIVRIDGGESALKLTVASYWRPSERNIHRPRNGGSDEWGVSPDSGFAVSLDDAQRGAIAFARRRRDYPATLLDPKTFAEMPDPMTGGELTEGEMPAIPEADDPVVDPQLERAIEAVLRSSSDVAVG
ncbi:MAG TPA: S41 family peptidase [Pirellulaceae bacterium]|nr:S41 family peptidase [Pirellulaceae bacterium]